MSDSSKYLVVMMATGLVAVSYLATSSLATTQMYTTVQTPVATSVGAAVRTQLPAHQMTRPSEGAYTARYAAAPVMAGRSPEQDWTPAPYQAAPSTSMAAMLLALIPAALVGYFVGGMKKQQQPQLAAAGYGALQTEAYSTAGKITRADTRLFAYSGYVGEKKAHITEAEKRALIDSTEVFVFDCDGVIWKGDSLIEGVPETLEMLKGMGKKLFFVTNNSTKSRKGYLNKFLSLGLKVEADEIYSSSYAAAAYLESINFPKNKKVYIIGEVGIEEELDLVGINYIGGPKDAGKQIELKAGFALDHDHDVAAVVVGFDRYFNYYKIQYAQLCINENPGCKFIATNTDAVTHLTDAQEWAGNGSMVGCIKGCTGQEPFVVGKPSGFMMDNIATKFGIDKSKICMVGDRLDTDILFGQNNGTNTMLVLSGVTTEETLAKSPVNPDNLATSIADFLTLKNGQSSAYAAGPVKSFWD